MGIRSPETPISNDCGLGIVPTSSTRATSSDSGIRLSGFIPWN